MTQLREPAAVQLQLKLATTFLGGKWDPADLATGCQDAQVWAGAKEAIDEMSDGFHKMLAVIQDEQPLLAPEELFGSQQRILTALLGINPFETESSHESGSEAASIWD